VFHNVLFTEVVSVILVMFSVVLHEVAHGWVAWKLGDPTAKQAGRLTLNPLKHLDPFGSVLLPLILAIVGGPVFAFAIPVPYNPNNLRNPRRDEVLVALAGPACNLLQAVLGAAVFRFLFRTQAVDGSVTYLVLSALATYVYVNLTLMFCNLIPLPPLDGSSIISPFLRGDARMAYYRVQQYAMPILIALLWLLPSILRFDPLGIYLNATAGRLYSILLGV
jgi:Zn-dependent protease